MEIKTKVGMVEITQKIKDDERLWWLQAAIEKADPRFFFISASPPL